MSSDPTPEPATGWLALPRCRVGGQLLPLVLLHPRYGIAIQGGPPDAVALLHQRLERARFPAIFPGSLPVVRTAPDQPPETGFDPNVPLDLPGGDAWLTCARRALERDAPQGEMVPIPARRRRHRRARRLAIAAGLAALLIGGVTLSILESVPAQSSLVTAPPS
ncbi:hypothetical protein JMJ56_02025 [Belnapia sp. T18]|uniref:Uncharacterized protein n=1 Tax=Belnapia arida TaxID=2804533 RepID=A0ABS1TY12_9PROT|nr:hypothetical protein [Belnapia arida]MBL6076765.1 hypothetical protein [Belnapia arida]